MELLYTVQKPKSTTIADPADFFASPSEQNKSLCAVSTQNVVAYTNDRELTENVNFLPTGYYVYVADLNTPWLSYMVTLNRFPVSILQWDITGKYLLIADIAGNAQIWIQKDNLLSEWGLYCRAQFPGEHIIRAVFFHNGRKLVVTDKKDAINYKEKYQRVKFAPSCRSFGGVASDGVFVVTATGLIGAFVIPSDTPNQNKMMSNQTGTQLPLTLTTTTRSLGQSRSHITIADISFAKNGHLLIAVSNGECDVPSSTMIHCYRVSIKKRLDTLTLTSQTQPSFFLTGGAGRDISDLKITRLQWMDSEDSESLLVASKTPSGCFIELWTLLEKATPIHSHFKQVFQQPNKTEVFKTAIWAHQVNYRYTSRVVDICTSKFHFGNTSYIFVSMMDNTIHCLQRDTLKRFTSSSLKCVWRNDGDHLSSKQSRIESTLTAHDITWMGHMLVATDAYGQLYAYRITYPHQEAAGGQMTISYAMLLLEYCLVGGYDALDIFVMLKVQQLDTIIDRLSENFARQPASTQQFYYVNIFAMKANLYRLSISGQPKAYDLTCFLMLHSILIGFKSLLRPSGLSSHDKGPAESLAIVLSESVPADIDKVLLGIEPKEFTVEAPTLQSLQQLIQWVADLTLNILAKLPDNRGMIGLTRSSGYDISKDIVALNSIRELLVMMRVWGLVRAQCLPTFMRSAENLDVLATLFRLVTRLTLNPNEPDDVLLDECCLLASQVHIPQLQCVSTQYSIASPMLFYINNLPFEFEYNVEPQNMKFTQDTALAENGSLSEQQIFDSIRHIQLGKRPGKVRRCTRCGAYTSLNSVARTAAMRAWEQRWASGCRCGGFWRLHIV